MPIDPIGTHEALYRLQLTNPGLYQLTTAAFWRLY